MGIKIALAGNPNAGKTTLFNALTGSNQFVGNWPGVTVEKKVFYNYILTHNYQKFNNHFKINLIIYVERLGGSTFRSKSRGLRLIL